MTILINLVIPVWSSKLALKIFQMQASDSFIYQYIVIFTDLSYALSGYNILAKHIHHLTGRTDCTIMFSGSNAKLNHKDHTKSYQKVHIDLHTAKTTTLDLKQVLQREASCVLWIHEGETILKLIEPVNIIEPVEKGIVLLIGDKEPVQADLLILNKILVWFKDNSSTEVREIHNLHISLEGKYKVLICCRTSLVFMSIVQKLANPNYSTGNSWAFVTESIVQYLHY